MSKLRAIMKQHFFFDSSNINEEKEKGINITKIAIESYIKEFSRFSNKISQVSEKKEKKKGKKQGFESKKNSLFFHFMQ